MTDNRPMIRWAYPLILASIVSVTGVAFAQNSDAVTKARALGQEAGNLLDQKRYQDALERVTEAESLYHAPTHLLMMAEAQEGLGRLAEAARTYERLAAEPMPAGAPAAFRNAQEAGKKQLRALLARLPSVLVQVRGPASSETRATLDGQPLDLQSGVAVRVDPGKHTVKLSADGYHPVEKEVDLPPRGGVVIVELTMTTESTPGVRPQLPAETPSPAQAPRDQGPVAVSTPSRLPAWIAFGVGGAGVVVGGITGALALGKVGDLKDRCPNSTCATSDEHLANESRTFGTISTIGFVVGAAGIGTGAVLLLLSNRKTEQPPAAALRPRATPWVGLGSVGLEGTF